MVSFYFDEMMAREPAQQLAPKGIDIIMAVDRGMVKKSDPDHLAYATQNNRVLVTFDRKFAGLTQSRTDHAGLICLTGRQDDYGMITRVLSQFTEEYTPESAKGRVFWR